MRVVIIFDSHFFITNKIYLSILMGVKMNSTISKYV